MSSIIVQYAQSHVGFVVLLVNYLFLVVSFVKGQYELFLAMLFVTVHYELFGVHFYSAGATSCGCYWLLCHVM